MIETLLFDLDNTLVECGVHYIESRDRFVAFQVRRTGIPKAAILAIFATIDLQAAELPNGFSRHRYPQSFRAVSYALDSILGSPLDRAAANTSALIAESVFAAPYAMYEGAQEVLDFAKTAGWRLVVWSKGDSTVQLRKLYKHGLHRVFDGIHVVPHKNEHVLQQVMDTERMHPNMTVMIGDSPRDDIAPAICKGMTTIQVVREGWAYDAAEIKPTHAVTDMFQLLAVIEKLSIGRKVMPAIT